MLVLLRAMFQRKQQKEGSMPGAFETMGAMTNLAKSAVMLNDDLGGTGRRSRSQNGKGSEHHHGRSAAMHSMDSIAVAGPNASA